MTRKILVVCHGNINRSPLCAAILAARCPATILQAALKEITRPERAAKKMRDAAFDLYDIDLSEHRSRPITRAMVHEADMVVYMDNGNLRRLKNLMYIETVPESWHCLAEYAEGFGRPDACFMRIPDPAYMLRDSVEFKQTVSLIAHASVNLARLIADEGADEED